MKYATGRPSPPGPLSQFWERGGTAVQPSPRIGRGWRASASRVRARRGALLLVLLAAACIDPRQSGEQGAAEREAGAGPWPTLKTNFAVTPRSAPVAEDGQWTMAARDYASTRFSGLDQINTRNVASLKLAWTFSDGNFYGHEGAPLVVGSTLYWVSPFPNQLFALDLARDGALKWTYTCLLYTSPSPRDLSTSRMPSSA